MFHNISFSPHDNPNHALLKDCVEALIGPWTRLSKFEIYKQSN
jgi:hypothetical protein